MKGRIERQEEIDLGIEKWTMDMDKYELMERCQEAGVRAMPVQSSEDRVDNDSQLRSRGMYTEMDHPILGRNKYQNAPFKLSKSPAEVYKAPPLIGEHNVEILEELLGVSRGEILEGYEDGTFWPLTMSKDPYPYVKEIQEALR